VEGHVINSQPLQQNTKSNCSGKFTQLSTLQLLMAD